MKKLLVGLASVTLAFSAWGQVRVNAGDGGGVPIENCHLAMQHRDAIKVHEGVVHENVYETSSITRYFIQTVLMLRSTNRLDAGYYSLQHKYWGVYPEATVCVHFSLQ